jgi:hypothetical protein
MDNLLGRVAATSSAYHDLRIAYKDSMQCLQWLYRARVRRWHVSALYD